MLRWLNTVFPKLENSRIKQLLQLVKTKTKTYLIDVKQQYLKGLIFSQKLHNCRCYGNNDLYKYRKRRRDPLDN